jgi:tetratricopeptide (TPR) repeat protein
MWLPYRPARIVMAEDIAVNAMAVSRPGRLRTITLPPPPLNWLRELTALEAAGDELGIAFWRVLRKVHDWAQTPAEYRAGLFEIDKRAAQKRLGDVCSQAPSLVEAFGTFARLIRPPEQVEARQVAEACHQAREWAEEQSMLEAAMLFAEAAALAEPEVPGHANTAGRLCRRAAYDERSTTWYHRGFGLAVRTRERTETIRALLGYGGLMYHLGRHTDARRYYERAVRVAVHTGRHRQAAEAKHDMVLIAAEAGTYQEGERHARQALQYYPVHHPRIPYLVHDVAFLFIRNRLYSFALPLLRSVRQQISLPGEQALVLSSLARAAAGAGQISLFREAADEVLSLVESFGEHAAAALWNVAEGAWSCADWERAERLAQKAVEIARTRKESEPERGASALLVRVAIRELSQPEAEPPLGNRIEQLSRGCLAKLNRWKVPG